MFSGMRRAARMLVPALALPLLLAGCTSSGGHGSGPSLPASPTSTPATTATPAPTPTHGTAAAGTIACAPTGSAARSTAALHRTLSQLRSRVERVGVDARVTLRPDGTFVIASRGSAPAPPVGLCATATIAFRPVVAGVHQPLGRTADPAARLDFALPRDERALLKLPAAERRALHSALRALRCAGLRVTTAAKPVFACDADGSAYLLAAPLLDGTEITSARAVAPDRTRGTVQWGVAVQVDSRARVALAKYTSTHNFSTTGGSGAPAYACDHRVVPCANFVAVVINGRVRSVPATSSPIEGGGISISGSFTKAAVTSLAMQLQAPLAVPLHVLRTHPAGTARPSASRS